MLYDFIETGMAGFMPVTVLTGVTGKNFRGVLSKKATKKVTKNYTAYTSNCGKVQALHRLKHGFPNAQMSRTRCFLRVCQIYSVNP